MTTKVTVYTAHAVHVEVRGEKVSSVERLEARSTPRDYIIWGEQVLTVKEVPNVASPVAA
jgi:hypothetical protein